jgi:hypothetical protein
MIPSHGVDGLVTGCLDRGSRKNQSPRVSGLPPRERLQVDLNQLTSVAVETATICTMLKVARKVLSCDGGLTAFDSVRKHMYFTPQVGARRCREPPLE